ncbi:hypothetical protein LEMLEM_LOCUS9123, partial [Lemmus lemmus]
MFDFIKAGNRQSASSWLGGNFWCWLSRVQLKEHRTADVAMVLEGISSDRGTPKAGEMSGAPQWYSSSGLQSMEWCHLQLGQEKTNGSGGITLLERFCGAGDGTSPAKKIPAAKLDDLSSIPRIDMICMEERTDSHKLSSDHYTCTM